MRVAESATSARTEIGIYPAVDPLDSTSTILTPEVVGDRHVESRQRTNVADGYRVFELSARNHGAAAYDRDILHD